MVEEKINEKLRQLYIDRLSAGEPCFLQILREQRRNIDHTTQPAYPLLIKINEEKYKNADLKIMVFGQETNSWEAIVSAIQIPLQDSCNHVAESVDVFMDNYFNFRNIKEYNSPFWNAFKTIKELSSDIKCELVWNNIYKIGNRERNKNRPHKLIRELENLHFDVIQEEISILKPDVILFLTGPNYDARVNRVFGITGYQSISNHETRKLAKISISVDMLAYRTYHPNYLQLHKLLKEHLKHIIADVRLENTK